MFDLRNFDIRRLPLVRHLASRRLSVILIALSAAFIAVEGSFGFGLQRHWSFVSIMIILMISLGLTAAVDFSRKSYCPLMSHLGLFLVLLGGLFGALDRTDVQLMAFADGRQECMAFDRNGNMVQLPFSISLKEFRVDLYEDGAGPRQFTSMLFIDGEELQTSVNHPCRFKGYRIYQSGYDSSDGRYSVLKLVRDPWLPLVALGALLLALSALLGLKSVWNSWKIPVAAIVLAVVFGAVSVARINFGALPPALRSLWFVPHLIVYMLAYSVMALSVITGLAALFTKRIPEGLPGKLLSTASSLLLIGMLCGAVWAKQAWGNYWTWDAKECWAAVTWLLSLCATHAPKKQQRLVFTLLAFLAIQMTWYGVNYLPTSDRSLHTYFN